MSTTTWNGLTIPAAGTYTIDVAHTRVGFTVKHMMVSKVRGDFTDFAGSVTVAENPLESTAELTIKTESINTQAPDRDGHLRSDDFLSAEKFPEITFRNGRVTSHSGDEFTVVGDLTIRGTTKEVTLKATYEGQGKDPWGGQRISFTASAKIDRRDFGLTWNQALETGGILVSNDIKINIEVQAVRA